MKFSENIKISTYDVDMHDNLRPTQLLAMLEEVGSHQMIKYPPNNDDLREAGMGFILSRVIMRVYDNLHSDEQAVGETWAAATSRGLSYNRCYRLTKDGEPVAEVYTVWALLNFKEGKLIRVDECADMHIGGEPEEPFELDIPLRVRMPKADEFCEVAKRKVYYSDTDLNGHMNNTKYLNMLCDFVPEIENKQLRGINISYVTEAPLGDELTIYCNEADGVYYFKTVRSDGKTNCEAVLYF